MSWHETPDLSSSRSLLYTKSNMFKFNLDGSQTIPRVRPSYNVGAGLDIPSCRFLLGKYGEYIPCGGVGLMTGVGGKPNTFKSMIAEFMIMSILNRYMSMGLAYDTESNKALHRLMQLAMAFPNLAGRDLFEEQIYLVSDKTTWRANVWYEWFKTFMDKKIEGKNKNMATTPFWDETVEALLRVIAPTPSLIDSFTKWESDADNERQGLEIGDKKALTNFMQKGLGQARFISDVPSRLAASNTPLILTAHIGKNIPMDGQMHAQKQMQFMGQGDKVKGVTDDFLYLTSIFWMVLGTEVLRDDETRGTMYPRFSGDVTKDDTDLMLVTMRSIRNKNGPSGLTTSVVVSQRDGVHPELTEYHLIKQYSGPKSNANKLGGLIGDNTKHALALLPEVQLTRKTARTLFGQNEQLKRALNLTSEICQYQQICTDPSIKFQSFGDILESVRSQGYDVTQLLDTRGWWTFTEVEDRAEYGVKPFLSSADLLRMANKDYHPYWLASDKKTIINPRTGKPAK